MCVCVCVYIYIYLQVGTLKKSIDLAIKSLKKWMAGKEVISLYMYNTRKTNEKSVYFIFQLYLVY